MKRFWLVLLSMGLVITCSASAFAVDVKISGSMYLAGMYLDRTTFKKDTATDGPSTALYFQRLRLRTDFVVSPGLTLVTRMDIMERAWGAPRSTPGTTADTASAGTAAENENIAFDWAYVNYASPMGIIAAGYMNDSVWGTAFADSATPAAKLAWIPAAGPWIFYLQIAKLNENSFTAKNPGVTASDLDSDKYVAAFKYFWKGGEVGILGAMGRNAAGRQTSSYKAQFYGLMPYTIAQLGPVKIQAELVYFWGKWQEYESGSGDVKLENLAGWLDVGADFGRFYVGGTFAYVAGDDPNTTDKKEGSVLVDGGRDWDPCLILWNNERTYWTGSLAGNGGSANAGPMSNAFFYQVRGGLKPTAQLDIMASFSYANADKKPAAGWISDTYGYEVDVTGTYKITNNLSYMLGAGYLWTGDYFKGTSASANVQNDFLLINKLTLTF